MPDREKVVEWLEFDYLTRVGAYRNDCKQGCDACMPMHDGDDYCDIDMLCKVLALLKEQEAVEPIEAKFETFGSTRKCSSCKKRLFPAGRYCPHCGRLVKWDE